MNVRRNRTFVLGRMFTNSSRLMLIAAHPDDEALACSVVLQRAVAAGAKVRVIYATDGENNPWPQRVLERKWRLNGSDRRRWGELRRAEAIAALEVLGVGVRGASFLGLPDQRLTELLVSKPGPVVERLAAIIEEWSPTDLFVPSLFDIHPDHSALGVLLRLMADYSFYGDADISFWSYLVHGKSRAFRDRATTIGQTAAERATKLRAIGCHQTQVRLFGKRFWDHAQRAEQFVKLELAATNKNVGVITSVSRYPRLLSLKLERPLKLVLPRKPVLIILGYAEDSSLRCVKTDIPVRTSSVKIRDNATNRTVAPGRYRGGAFVGNLEIPISVFSTKRPLFIKVERRGWFFDEAGWLELSACAAAESVPSQIGLGEVYQVGGCRASA
jgi:LmbE family N-acetylglucosaminyl deacetylase